MLEVGFTLEFETWIFLLNYFVINDITNYYGGGGSVPVCW